MVGGQERGAYEVDDLAELVEPPLLAACQELFDKGILTYTSSANRAHYLENGNIHPAVIGINYDALSPENKKVVEELKLAIHEANLRNNYRTVGLEVPLTSESTIGSVQDSSLELTHRFLPQEFPVPVAHTLEWYARNIVGYTEITPEVLEQCEGYVRNDPELVYNEKEKIFARAAEVKRWEDSVRRNSKKQE